MCGILGWFGRRDADDSRCFESALDTIRHRGPDDMGMFERPGVLLGHRRLSIIDLTPAGHQPMVDPASGCVIVFNGEIYNYLELRAELASKGNVFRTESDTEVLLRGIVHWGVADCVARLNGMWSFAIWNPRERTLVLSRDRFGVKPLYYSHNRHGFAFASEPKALLALMPELRAVDEGTLYRFLANGQLADGPASFYQGISSMPPAHFAEFHPDTNHLTLSRYWDYPEHGAADSSANESKEGFAALMDDAVRLRLRSDVAVGVTLSGGLDSTAILAGAIQGGARPTCFTSVYGANGTGESSWAQTAAAPYGIRPIEIVAQRTGWLETLASIAWHMDGPGYSPAVYPAWRIMAAARSQGVPVLLEGQGADEELGGYPQYGAVGLLSKFAAFARTPSRGRLRSARVDWTGLSRTFTTRWVSLWLLREAAPALVGLNRRRVGAASVLRRDAFACVNPQDRTFRAAHASAHMDAITARLWRDHSRDILPGLLQYGDAISMAHSIEGRLPFLDYRLVEWLFARTADTKIRAGETKWVLREYLRARSQDTIGNRADKLGYPTPADEWLAANDGSLPREYLLSSDSAVLQYCNRDRIERLIQMHARGAKGVGNHLYRLLSTEIWLQECILAPRKSPPSRIAA